MNIPENTQMDADFWRDVERAKRLSPQERVRIGHELFERSIYLMTQGLRMQYPECTEEQLAAMRRERLARIHQWESRSAQVGTDRQTGAGVVE